MPKKIFWSNAHRDERTDEDEADESDNLHQIPNVQITVTIVTIFKDELTPQCTLSHHQQLIITARQPWMRTLDTNKQNFKLVFRESVKFATLQERQRETHCCHVLLVDERWFICFTQLQLWHLQLLTSVTTTFQLSQTGQRLTPGKYAHHHKM